MRSRRKRVGWTVAAVLIAMLVALRLALPTLVQRYVNNKLDELPQYDGRIGDVDIALFRGAYTIEDVDIVKTSGRVRQPFFEAASVDLSMQWAELLHGALVGEIFVDRGKLNFVKAETEQESQTSIDDSWLEVVQDLFPFRINRFEIQEGVVWFQDVHAEPKVDVYLTNMVAVCTNLYNTRDFRYELPADFRATGETLGGGLIDVHVKLDPLALDPRFDLELAVEEMDLTALNDLLRAYGKFDVKSGMFEVFAEIACERGEFNGYVKPLFHDLDVLELKEDSENPLNLIWQTLVAGAVKIFKNHPEDQVATRIPISGEIGKETQVGIWTTLANVLRNAFVEAFRGQIDESVNLFSSSGASADPDK